jgi:hypothetical protein
MIVAAHRRPIDLKKRLHQSRAYTAVAKRPRSNPRVPAPRDDVNAAKSADMSKRSEA